MTPTRTMVRWALVVGLSVAACGGSADNSDSGDIEGVQPDDLGAADDAGQGSGECLLDEEAMSSAVGVAVRFDGPAGGDAGGARGGLDHAQTYSLSWRGWRYAAEDGIVYAVSELVDGSGAPDVTGLDDLFALAETDGLVAAEEVPDLGDTAFVDAEGRLNVLDGDATIALKLEHAAPVANDAETLRSIASGLVNGPEVVGVSALCFNAMELVPDEWGQPFTDVAGSTGGNEGAGGVQASYEQCTVELDGEDDRLVLQLGDAELYDVRWTTSGPDASDSDPVPIDDLGDGALWFGSRLHVRIGDQGLVIEGFAPDGQPVGRDALMAVAAAVVDAVN